MDHWFEGVADYLGDAYRRYSFTYGTVQEVDVLIDVLGLGEGSRLLDVGCGPGRHSHELARRGIEVVGIDVSETFVDLARRDAPEGATFIHGDARTMVFDSEFNAAISLCQGAFGLAGGPGADSAVLDPDGAILDRIVAAVRPGGGVVLSAFSAYFQVRFLAETDDFDADTGINREHTVLRNGDGAETPAELWTTCFTPRELRLLADRAGLVVDEVRSVTPGDYALRPPDLEHPEFLMIGRRAD
ncbi:MAG: class I SAM-dependent methyltransferase [Acidimicrobiaceae bacterium]|jgi:SAM-dependent methyltransferase|nr:class I SAM-dependent methyltransferase [Acidimicrobiaceae bacterium]MBT6372217.1 class I SAM-dependent methyltransferase [Acidimicrobiaceae bacterium]